MKYSKIFFRSVIFFFAVFSLAFGQNSYNFNDGLKAAKSSGKKIFVGIYSNSDNWSKKMDSDIYSSSKVSDALANFVFVKLNADSNEEFNYQNKSYTSSQLADYFGGTGYPTFVFMNPDGSVIKFKYNGEEISNLSGFLGENDFIELLNFFSQGKYKTTDLSDIFQN